MTFNHVTELTPAALRQIPNAEFYEQDVVQVARSMIGMLLCRRSRAGLCVGRIIETEAYLATNDPAAHSFRGLNRKNASMFGPPGRAYVYTIHARQCFNVVTQKKNVGSAVLIRAVEPLIGTHLMEHRRKTSKRRDLCRGPARLCEAFDIDRNHDGWSLLNGSRLWLADNPFDHPKLHTTPRIGVTSAHDLPLRFIIPNNDFLSGPRALNNQIKGLTNDAYI